MLVPFLVVLRPSRSFIAIALVGAWKERSRSARKTNTQKETARISSRSRQLNSFRTCLQSTHSASWLSPLLRSQFPMLTRATATSTKLSMRLALLKVRTANHPLLQAMARRPLLSLHTPSLLQAEHLATHIHRAGPGVHRATVLAMADQPDMHGQTLLRQRALRPHTRQASKQPLPQWKQ